MRWSLYPYQWQRKIYFINRALSEIELLSPFQDITFHRRLYIQINLNIIIDHRFLSGYQCWVAESEKYVAFLNYNIYFINRLMYPAQETWSREMYCLWKYTSALSVCNIIPLQYELIGFYQVDWQHLISPFLKILAFSQIPLYLFFYLNDEFFITCTSECTNNINYTPENF